MMGAMASRRPALPWLSTLSWGVVGTLGSFGVAALPTVGVFLLAGAAVVAAIALAVPALRPPCTPGFLVGLSTAPLFLAWLNRGGPGLVCTTADGVTSCDDAWSPWPFVAIGVLFAAAGLALLVIGRRGSGRPANAVAEAAGSAPRT